MTHWGFIKKLRITHWAFASIFFAVFLIGINANADELLAICKKAFDDTSHGKPGRQVCECVDDDLTDSNARILVIEALVAGEDVQDAVALDIIRKCRTDAQKA